MSIVSRPRSHRWVCTAVLLIAMWGFLWCVASPVTAATGQLTATWTQDTAEDLDGFKLIRKTGTTGTYALIATVDAAVRSYIDTGLSAGGTYCYQLAAYNAAGDSPYTPETCANVPTAVGYTLAVSTVGSGSVASSPGGIDCGASCSANFTGGTTIALSATPASTFTGWSGACSGTDTCVLTMSQPQNVTATFNTAAPPPSTTFTLSVTKSGTGTVGSTPAGITCGSTCNASYTSGTSVTLTAFSAVGSTFTGWGGACSGSGSCTVTLSQAQDVTATFIATPGSWTPYRWWWSTWRR